NKCYNQDNLCKNNVSRYTSRTFFDNSRFRHFIENRHSDFVGFLFHCYKDGFDYDERSLQKQSKINSSHRNQIGRQALNTQHHNSKQERKRNNGSHNYGRPPIIQKDKNDNRNKENSLYNIFGN